MSPADFLWIGYSVTWLAVAGYAWRLERRRAEAERDLDRLRDARSANGGEG